MKMKNMYVSCDCPGDQLKANTSAATYSFLSHLGFLALVDVFLAAACVSVLDMVDIVGCLTCHVHKKGIMGGRCRGRSRKRNSVLQVEILYIYTIHGMNMKDNIHKGTYHTPKILCVMSWSTIRRTSSLGRYRTA